MESFRSVRYRSQAQPCVQRCNSGCFDLHLSTTRRDTGYGQHHTRTESRSMPPTPRFRGIFLPLLPAVHGRYPFFCAAISVLHICYQWRGAFLRQQLAGHPLNVHTAVCALCRRCRLLRIGRRQAAEIPTTVLCYPIFFAVNAEQNQVSEALHTLHSTRCDFPPNRNLCLHTESWLSQRPVLLV
jgi:NAD-dependent dihydropyrimidine dehydrogenase PreA subunit